MESILSRLAEAGRPISPMTTLSSEATVSTTADLELHGDTPEEVFSINYEGRVFKVKKFSEKAIHQVGVSLA